MSMFRRIVSHVSRLKPGESATFSRDLVYEGWGNGLFDVFMGGFTPPDRVLENVMSSSVTHRYVWTDHGELRFQRLHAPLPDGVRSYVSPDRLHYFRKRLDGLYQHIESETSTDEDKIRCALEGHRWLKAWVMPPLGPLGPVSEMSEAATVQLVEGKRCYFCGLHSDR